MKEFLLASDFDQTLSFNDSGMVLSEMLGIGGFVWWNADAGDRLALSFHATLGAEAAPVTDFLLAGPAFDQLARSAA